MKKQKAKRDRVSVTGKIGNKKTTKNENGVPVPSQGTGGRPKPTPTLLPNLPGPVPPPVKVPPKPSNRQKGPGSRRAEKAQGRSSWRTGKKK